jgi:hypothetical protein
LYAVRHYKPRTTPGNRKRMRPKAPRTAGGCRIPFYKPPALPGDAVRRSIRNPQSEIRNPQSNPPPAPINLKRVPLPFAVQSAIETPRPPRACRVFSCLLLRTHAFPYRI